jgi:lysophospholipase L1-like esterase
MPELFLLGDSVIDNAAYVAPGEPDLTAQLKDRLPDWTVERLAVDGYRTGDVADDLPRVPPAAAVFLSAGGNDALGHMELLADPAPITFAAALARLREVREGFRAQYGAVLDGLAGRRVMVATVYNPSFTGEEAALQPAAEGGLSAFNDVIQSEATARRFAVLDLRRLFTEAADYANPIEPSAQGGAKIADAVARWCSG